MELLKTPTKQELMDVEKLIEPVLVLEPKTPEISYTIDESDVAYQLENFDFSIVKSEKQIQVQTVSAPNSTTISTPNTVLNPDLTSVPKSEVTATSVSASISTSIEVKPGLKSQDVEDSFQFSQKIRSVDTGHDLANLESSLLFSSPVKRLKKKSEPLDKLKVQIPRPEEKL
jgi:hypothetical protein